MLSKGFRTFRDVLNPLDQQIKKRLGKTSKRKKRFNSGIARFFFFLGGGGGLPASHLVRFRESSKWKRISFFFFENFSALDAGEEVYLVLLGFLAVESGRHRSIVED